jgi:hypothetical protein
MRNHVDDRFLEDESVWRERVLPEIEWDANEESLLVDEVIGKSGARETERA